MTSQKTIDIEASAGRLLRQLTASGRLSVAAVDPKAGHWLASRGYAIRASKWLIITEPRFDSDNNRMPGPETGREYYERLCANPSVTASPSAWVEEARSGMASGPGPIGTVTRQSEIDRAVIPSPTPPGSPKSPEQIAAANERQAAGRRRMLEKLGCSEAELERLGQEGRVRVCPMCEDVGIFDRDRGGWKSKCRRCRKAER